MREERGAAGGENRTLKRERREGWEMEKRGAKRKRKERGSEGGRGGTVK